MSKGSRRLAEEKQQKDGTLDPDPPPLSEIEEVIRAWLGGLAGNNLL